MSYLGYDIFMGRPWAQAYSAPSNNYIIRGGEILPRRKYTNELQAEILNGWSFHCFNRADMDAYRDFFDLKQGKLTPFWLPSWKNDYQLTIPIVTEGPVSVSGIDENWANELGTINRHIYIPSTAGAFKITSLVSWNATNKIAVLGLNETPGEIAIGTEICNLYLVRFNNDSQTWKQGSSTHWEVSFDFIELPRETP